MRTVSITELSDYNLLKASADRAVVDVAQLKADVEQIKAAVQELRDISTKVRADLQKLSDLVLEPDYPMDTIK